MEWVRKIENYFQTPRVSTQRALDLLVQTLGETSKLVEISQSNYKNAAAVHLFEAEELHASALRQFQKEIYSVCQRDIEQASLRLQMAQLLLDANTEAEANTLAGRFDFLPASTEFLLNQVLESIARTKLIVESGNLNVKQKTQDNLFEAVKLARQALSLLKNEEFKDARRYSLASYLLLTRVCALLSVDNQQSTFQIDIPEAASDSVVAQVRRLIDEMTACLVLMGDAGIVHSAKIERHFKEAEERFGECISGILDMETYVVPNAVVAGLSELELVRHLASHSASLIEAEEKEGQFSADGSFKAFESCSAEIVRTAQKVTVRDFRTFTRRMDSSLVYFGRAVFQFKGDNLQESLRLATAAYLDLDFALQIALTSGKPEYRDTDF